MEENSFNIDTAQIEKIMSIMKIFNNINSMSGQKEEVVENEVGTEIIEKLDESTALKKIKDVLPFIEMPYQKNIGLMVKLMEIDKLVNNFRAMSISGEDNLNMKRKMLMAIKPELDLRKQKLIDIFVRVMEISDIVEGLKNYD